MLSLLSAGMCTITWVGNMITCWRSWLPPCAPTGLLLCGWDPARRCWPGLSSTVSASTLSCGPPSSSPWSLLLLLRFVRGVYALVFHDVSRVLITFILQAAMSEATSRRIRAIFNTFNFWCIILYNALFLTSLDFAKLVAKRLLLKGTNFVCFKKGISWQTMSQ